MESLPKIDPRAKYFTLNGDEYEVIPPHAVSATNMLVNAFERLGSPEDPFSDSGKKFMKVLVAMWQDYYPKDSAEWIAMRSEHLNAEMSIKEQVRQGTGRSLASIPMFIHKVMRKVFPMYKSWGREEYMKFAREYPIFKMANKL